MRKVTAITALLIVILVFHHSPILTADATYEETVIIQETVVVEEKQAVATRIMEFEKIEEETVEEEFLSDEDIALIALVTMAEAEGECEQGKRLVIDTILNRMDSEYFPDNIHDVIYQPYQCYYYC